MSGHSISNQASNIPVDLESGTVSGLLGLIGSLKWTSDFLRADDFDMAISISTNSNKVVLIIHRGRTTINK